MARESTPKKSRPTNEAGREGKPVSLAPLTFDEALGGLLKTDAKAVRELEKQAADKRTAARPARK